MWKAKRPKKCWQAKLRRGQADVRPETPEELAAYREARDGGPAVVDERAQVSLSPRTGAYLNADSPLDPGYVDGSEQPSRRRRSGVAGDDDDDGMDPGTSRLKATWSMPAAASSRSLLGGSSGRANSPFGDDKGKKKKKKKPKKGDEWGWAGARCRWMLLGGPGGPPKVSIDLYADNVHGHDSKIGSVSLSLDEIAAACKGRQQSEPIWLRIFTAGRGTRTHKWQGSEESHPEEGREVDHQGRGLKLSSMTEFAAIGAVQVVFGALDGLKHRKPQRIFSAVSSVELSVKQREREEQERQEGLAAAATVEDQEERDDY